jgi:hypothetical protein
MKSRDEIYGGSFNSPESADTNTNGFLKNLVLSQSTDTTKNRSSWLRTIFYNVLDSFMHKTEDRATKDNLGVSIDSSQKIYTTPEQLPAIDKTTNNFVSVPTGTGSLSTEQNVLNFSVNGGGKNKIFILRLHDDFIGWLKARTYTNSELTTSVTNIINTGTIDGSGSGGSSLIPVGVIWRYSSIVAPDGFLILKGTSIGNTGSGATDADPKYEKLFKHIWNNYANSECAVSGDRGANANSDWLANKNITLPDYRGKVSGTYKSGDTNFGTLGKSFGAEIIPNSALPVESPYDINDPQHEHLVKPEQLVITGGEAGNDGTPNIAANVTGTNFIGTTKSYTGITLTDNEGGGQKHFQPTIVDVAIIKY